MKDYNKTKQNQDQANADPEHLKVKHQEELLSLFFFNEKIEVEVLHLQEMQKRATELHPNNRMQDNVHHLVI